MKTDYPIYLFLSTGPEAFRILSGEHQLDGDYRFRSLSLRRPRADPAGGDPGGEPGDD